MEIRGDPVLPSVLILPEPKDGVALTTGATFLSGAKIWFYTGTGYEIVTSA